MVEIPTEHCVDDNVTCCSSHDDSVRSCRSEEAPSSTKEQLLVNVAINDSTLAALIARAREVQATYFAEDYISCVSKRSGYRLTLFTKLLDGVETLLGYVVYRFRPVAVSVVQVAIAQELQGQGFGRKLMKWLIQHSKKANAELIALSSLPASTSFYQHLGFKRVKVNGISGEDYVEGQVYMEYRCRRPLKANQRISRSTPEAGAAGPLQNELCVSSPSLESQCSTEKAPGEAELCAEHNVDFEERSDGQSTMFAEPQPENCLADGQQEGIGSHKEIQHFDVDSHERLDHERSTSVKPSTRWSFRLRAQVAAKSGGAPAESETGAAPQSVLDGAKDARQEDLWHAPSLQSCALQERSAAASADSCMACPQNRRRVWRATRA